MDRSNKLRTLSFVLIAVLVFTAVFSVFYSGAVGVGDSSALRPETIQTNAGLKKSDINMDSVREQYLKYNNFEKNVASYDGARWVVVELEGESLYDAFKQSTRYSDFTEYVKSIEAKKVLASIRAKQSRFLDKLDKNGIAYDYKYSYSALSTGVAIKIEASAYNSVNAMSGVEDIFYSEHYAVPEYNAVQNNANVYSTGIYDTKDLIDVDGKSYQGQGMAVAILDTGLDRTHEAFDPTVYEADLEEVGALDSVHFDRDDIADLMQQRTTDGTEFKLTAAKNGADINDVYYNLKVPFAYDYADDDAEVYPAYSNHGTHVAGIVAGKSDYVVNEETKETFRGVAPLAQLVICKVFTDDLFDDTIGGADNIDILAALEDCVTLGVDVINMSLGTSAGFSDEKSDAYSNAVYNSIREMGISLVCAASNDYSSGFGGGNGTNLASNPDSGTVGTPSTYFSALSVASINGKKSKYIQGNGNTEQVAFITNSADGDGNRIEFIDELHKQLEEKYGPAAAAAGADLRGGDIFTKSATDDLKLKYVLIGGVGRPSNYTSSIRNQLTTRTYQGEKVDATVALVRRGDTTFAEKVQEAMGNGADAVIVYNNVSGTINMSLGEVRDPVPTCLITMDAAVPFVEFARSHSNIGTIDVSYSFEAGPFMSDFSSWGPVSDLTLKPEITAHGGEITSAVPGAYDVLSGTSMASPNMAGAVAVLRQYLQETTELTGNELNARVNQMLMSTATIAYNEEGNPYSPRKQGAGLAGIVDAVNSEGYITVQANDRIYTKENESTKYCIMDGGWLDKTKVELLDDPQRKGEYSFSFTVWNISGDMQVYAPTTHVMTETLASDQKTVAEKAYMLTDMCTITYGGEGYDAASGHVIVQPNSHAEVTVKITLGKEARDYLEQEVTRQWVENGTLYTQVVKAFANGMYVEGFVSLDNVTYDNVEGKDGVTLGLPYLAYYGDWTAAPLFDYDIYEVSESEANNAIEFDDKLRTTSSPTQVIGMYHNDDYIIPLGSYLYEMDEEEDEIYPSREKIALSMYDEEGSYTVYELYAAYAGLLRNASKITTNVRNVKTGEVVYTEDLYNVSKALASGGANRGAFVRYEINPSQWGWQNNDEYYFTVQGWLDYGTDNKPLDYTNGEPNNAAQSTAKDDERQTAWNDVRNTFEFPLTIDYEAPQILDYKIRFDSYKENNVMKYRVYLDMSVYDNQYVMAILPCFLKEETEGKLGTYLNLLTEYPIPVYGNKGETSTVSIEITDYYERYGLTGELYVQVEDYAMNSEVYSIALDEDSLTYPDEVGVEFIEDDKLTKTGSRLNISDNYYNIYSLKLKPYELYSLNLRGVVNGKDSNYIFQNLQWKGESDNVITNEGEIYSLAYRNNSRPTRLTLVGEVFDSERMEDVDCVYAQIDVTVTNEAEGSLPSRGRLTLNFRPIHAGDNHVVNINNQALVEVHPNSVAEVEPYILPWYFERAYEAKTGNEFTFEWSVSNEDIATAEPGVGHTYAQNSRGEETEEILDTYLIGSVKFLKRGNVTVTCRAAEAEYSVLSKSVNFAVGDDYRVENYYMYEWYGDNTVELPSDVNVLYLDEDCFKNDLTITDVILPPMLMEIPNYAFQGCKNLKTITISSQCTTIGPFAFEGCTSLETVIFPEYMNANKDKVPGYYGSITVGHYAFAGCTSLKDFKVQKEGADGTVTLENNSDRMTTMYDGAFARCTSLTSIDISELRIVGSGVFMGCTGLETVTTSESTVFGPFMFAGCTNLEGFEFKGNRLPEYAFSGCEKLSDFTLTNTGLLSIGERALEETAISSLKLPAGNYTIGGGAFANCEQLTSVTFDGNSTVTFTGSNPFEGCTQLKTYTVEGNATYKVKDDGALYNATEDTLIALPAGVTTYTFPAGVTKIGNAAFSGSAITQIDLTNIESIGTYAFADSALKSVVWSSHMTEIPEGTFSGCRDLDEISNVDGVLKVGAHAFENCSALSSVALINATEIGDRAFAFISDSGLTATTNALRLINAPKVEKIGNFAFAGAGLMSAQFESATSIGSYAFALANRLTTASFGAVVEMGSHAFYRASALRTATFANGTTRIGDYAFSVFDPRYDNLTALDADAMGDAAFEVLVWQNYDFIVTAKTLETVTLPSTVTYIGAYAFTGQAGLRNLELGGVTEIGANAFRLCTALDNVDLTSVETVGSYAFYGAGLTKAQLDSAKVIGDHAFAGGDEIFDSIYTGTNITHLRGISGGKLRELSIPKVERIGEFAFAGNELTIVEIPATLNQRYYSFVENIYDKKGRVERQRTRLGETYGAGAFAYNSKLTEIRVAAGNPVYTSIDGVLYAWVEDKSGATFAEPDVVERKLRLMQYPGGKRVSGNTYKVADMTNAIADSAFEGADASGVKAVEFPYTLKEIGSAAFFSSRITDYTFTSVQAPTLVASIDSTALEIYKGIFVWLYNDQLGHYPWERDPESSEGEVYLDMDNIYITALYSNFHNYVFMAGYGNIFFSMKGIPLEDDPHRDIWDPIYFTVPRNGVGYDSALFEAYAEEIYLTEEDMPDDTVYELREAMSELKAILATPDAVKTLSKADLVETSAISLAIKAVRAAYNNVASGVQQEFVSEEYADLLSYEKAMREARVTNDIAVTLERVTLLSSPNKTNYNEGDKFDPTGMVIRVQYSDGSELRIESDGITIADDNIKYGEYVQVIKATYYDEFTRTTQTFDITVNVSISGGDGPSDPSGTEGGTQGGLPAWAIALIVIGAALVAAGAAVAVVLTLKKRSSKGGEKKADDKQDGEQNKPSDGETEDKKEEKPDSAEEKESESSEKEAEKSESSEEKEEISEDKAEKDALDKKDDASAESKKDGSDGAEDK